MPGRRWTAASPAASSSPSSPTGPRETTERPEGVEAGTAKLVGTDANRVVAEAERLLDDPRAYAAMAQAHNPLGDRKATERIVELIGKH